jgi:hypothetical protein
LTVPLRSNDRGAFFSTGLRRDRRWGAAPWPVVWAARSRSKGPHLANRHLLRDLNIERNLFCPLTVAEMDGGWLATWRRLGQSSTVVGPSSSGAPALGSAPVAAERLGQPLSGLGLARQASGWHGADGSVWKWERQWAKVLGRLSEGPIYRGKGTSGRTATA